MQFIEELTIRMACENPRWGYTRIQGALQNVGHRVGRTTIANILHDNGIDPAPERGKRTTWSQLLKAHWNVLAAADFFTVEVWAPRGLVTFYVFFMIELSTRKIEIAGITASPNEAWMMQIGRNVTDPLDGFLAEKKLLILDRDSKFSSAFRDLLDNSGVRVVRLPAERFVRSIKDECLSRMIFFGERSLRKATREYAAHYHGERNHQGIDNRLIEPDDCPRSTISVIECVQRLGGMLRFYHRAAA
jgi:transposase InsO family protein